MFQLGLYGSPQNSNLADMTSDFIEENPSYDRYNKVRFNVGTLSPNELGSCGLEARPMQQDHITHFANVWTGWERNGIPCPKLFIQAMKEKLSLGQLLKNIGC